MTIRYPICEAELDLPCKCDVVFEALAEQAKAASSWREQHRLADEAARIYVEHQLGRHYVEIDPVVPS